MEKIKDIKIYKAESKLSRPIADATHSISHISFVIVNIITDKGNIGEGYLLSFNYSQKGIIGTLKDVAKIFIDRELNDFLGVESEYIKEFEYFGLNGLQKWAYSTLNVAMWDAFSRSMNLPIYKVLGGTKKKINVYGSGGWLSYSIDELINEVQDYKSRGFQAVKIKVGSKDINTDIERITKVREAVGNEIKIMIDANQGMNVPDALKLAEFGKKIDIHWFEEPIKNTDFDGYKTIRNKTGVSIAMGEREYDMVPLRELIMRDAIDLWQPDIIRIGGVDEWRKSAHLAEAHNIPVLPHYYKDYDIPLLCTINNGYGCESFDWIDSIIDNTIKIDNGYALPRDGNGWGFRFKEDCLKEEK